jgi:hypothetical protein
MGRATPLGEFLAGRDVPCHACGYNLRGVRGVQCPECGVVIPRPSVVPSEDQGGSRRLNRITMIALRIVVCFGGLLGAVHLARLMGGGNRMDAALGLVLAAVPGAGMLAWMMLRRRIAGLAARLLAGLIVVVSLVAAVGSHIAAW